MDEPEREGEKEKLEGGRTSTTICDRSENDPQRCHVSENQDSALNIESFGGCENRWTMSTGPTWGSRLFLAFATTTIVITNYQCHCERTHLREKLVNGYRMMRNITGLQVILSALVVVPPNPHEILTRWFDLKIDTHLINVLGLSWKMGNNENFQL
uniref:Uncharacterized protein n=1 Tax=Vespula pensylvanica TaxID=30213 RepID=A0A834P277_VESPE|nr:hypothetical protein H0235_007802 [Vespula pensylvanica]